jgi:protein-S-isoprenylcysteine O-methyltransferase Ste14
LLFTARYQLGRSFIVTPQARELVTHGLCAKIRNPIYVFGGLLGLGFLLTLQRPYLLLILLVLIPIQIVRARKEAEVLEVKFGDAYREYRNKTWF